MSLNSNSRTSNTKTCNRHTCQGQPEQIRWNVVTGRASQTFGFTSICIELEAICLSTWMSWKCCERSTTKNESLNTGAQRGGQDCTIVWIHVNNPLNKYHKRNMAWLRYELLKVIFIATLFHNSHAPLLVTLADYFMNLSWKRGGEIFSIVCLGATLLIYSAVVYLLENTVSAVKQRPLHMWWNTDREG